jgi:hypothetical protein
MFSQSSVIPRRIVCVQIMLLLAMAPGELLAVQIEPNPNPEINTITITPSTPRENLVPFTNLGFINIETAASLHNGNRLDNSGVISSAGTITNSGVVNNNSIGITVLEGSQFTNLASGLYNGFRGGLGIGGTFINEGAVTHSLGYITVGETGQYIQRQAVGSSVTPTTITPDAPFRNAGRVHIAAGDFNVDPISVRAGSATYYQSSTGTTQIDARFQNIGGTVVNAGAITIGSTGEYRQQGLPGLFLAGSTINTGTFTNHGTTNINTGDFENARFFTNTGTVRISEGATFTNASSGIYHPLPGGTTRIDGNFINNFAVQNGGAITVSTTGSYSQVAGTSPIGTGTGNGGSFTNAGQVYIGKDTSFNSSPGAAGQSSAGHYVQQVGGTTRIDGSFNNRGYVTNEGAITVGATGKYLQSRADITGFPPVSTTNTGTFTNAGQVRIGEGTSFGNFPRLENGAPPAVGGQYIQQIGGTTQIDGSFLNGGGRVTNEYKITVGATGTFNQTRSSAPVPGTPTTVNIGAFTNAGNTLINAGTFTNQGSLVNSGTVQIGGNGAGTLTNQGAVINTGTFDVAALGQVSGAGSYLQNAAVAQTIVNGTFGNNIALQAGNLSGTGTITGMVANTGGVVQPGSSVLPGTLTLANYTQGIYGRLDLKIGGLLAGTQYDVLKVTGPGTFGGRLSVSLINGFTPGLGNRFDLLTCSLGCSGLNSGALFSGGVSLPSLTSGLDWISGLTDGGNSFSLTVVAAAVSAPEPGTLLLVASGLVGLVAWQRKRRIH